MAAPFSPNWFVFGADNFGFAFWLCAKQPVDDKCLEVWDHDAGVELGAPTFADLKEMFVALYEEMLDDSSDSTYQLEILEIPSEIKLTKLIKELSPYRLGTAAEVLTKLRNLPCRIGLHSPLKAVTQLRKMQADGILCRFVPTHRDD